MNNSFMKKTLLFLAAAGLALLASSCRKDEVVPVTVSVTVDESALVDVPLPDTYTVTLTNLSTAQTLSSETENLTATFPSVVPGLYSVSASASSSEGGVTWNYSGTVATADISSEGQTISVQVASSESAALVFKEIY